MADRVTRLQSTLSGCVSLLQEYRGLLEGQTTACYVRDMYSAVPADWLAAIETLQYHQLLRLRENAGSLGNGELKTFCDRVAALSPDFPKAEEELQPRDIETWGMSPKKQHEVRRLAAYIKRLTETLHLSQVVDLGAGLGYLSHFLSTSCGLRVLGVESKAQNSHAAEVRSAFLSHRLRQDSSFSVVSLHVTNENFPTLCDSPCVLVGLHTCGDLAPISLRMAAAVPCVRAIVSVGCCYNLLSEGIQPPAAPQVEQYLSTVGVNDAGESLDHTLGNDVDTCGFPMSDFMKSRFPEFFLGRMARILALTDLSEEMRKEPQAAMEKYSFRAAFQWLLAQYHPHLAHTYSVGRKVKCYHSFSDYATQASTHKGIAIPLSAAELNELYEARFRPQEKKSAALWALRSLLAPVVENVILCDRVLFLLERGLDASVVQVFDRQLSPRCWLISGVKPVS